MKTTSMRGAFLLWKRNIEYIREELGEVRWGGLTGRGLGRVVRSTDRITITITIILTLMLTITITRTGGARFHDGAANGHTRWDTARRSGSILASNVGY